MEFWSRFGNTAVFWGRDLWDLASRKDTRQERVKFISAGPVSPFSVLNAIPRPNIMEGPRESHCFSESACRRGNLDGRRPLSPFWQCVTLYQPRWLSSDSSLRHFWPPLDFQGGHHCSVSAVLCARLSSFRHCLGKMKGGFLLSLLLLSLLSVLTQAAVVQRAPSQCNSPLLLRLSKRVRNT